MKACICLMESLDILQVRENNSCSFKPKTHEILYFVQDDSKNFMTREAKPLKIRIIKKYETGQYQLYKNV
jgi:hypothetical protein